MAEQQTKQKRPVTDISKVPAIASEGEQSAVIVKTEDVARLNTLMKVSAELSKSGMYPDLNNSGKYLAVILAGDAFGLAPMTALMNVHIVNGRPGFSAQAIGAFLRRAGVKTHILECSSERCRIKFTRDGAEPFEYEFNSDDANRAGKIPAKPGSVWSTYPQDMLFARALTGGGRKFAPDAMIGAYVPDELEEFETIPDEAPEVVSTGQTHTATINPDEIKQGDPATHQGHKPAPKEDTEPEQAAPETKEPEKEEPPADVDVRKKLMVHKVAELVDLAGAELARLCGNEENPVSASEQIVRDAVADRTLNNIDLEKNNKGQLSNLIIKLRNMGQQGAPETEPNTETGGQMDAGF